MVLKHKNNIGLVMVLKYKKKQKTKKNLNIKWGILKTILNGVN